MSQFSIIIPSRNASNMVPCVRAIREAGETCRIIVVDDGVDWGDVITEIPGAAAVYLGVKEVEGIKPFVFARNVNLGIAAAGDDDVIVLNDDALLKTPHGFWDMEGASRLNPDYGVIAAACDVVGNQNQFSRSVDKEKRAPAGDLTPLRDEPHMVCFVCVYIPRSTINTVGLLDERFTDYGMEDDDYCLRVRNAGLKIGIFDGCFVDHGSLTSSFRGAAGAGGNFEPNLARFIEKWGFDNRGLSYKGSPWKKLWNLEEQTK